MYSHIPNKGEQMERVASIAPLRSYRQEIANFVVILLLTYEIIVSYTPKDEKQYLINQLTHHQL